MDATHAAGRSLNRAKADYGLIPQAGSDDQRISWAVNLIAEIDRLMVSTTHEEFEREMARLRPEIERANMSTVCDKRELNLDVTGPRLNYGQVASMIAQDVVQTVGRALSAPFRRSAITPAETE